MFVTVDFSVKGKLSKPIPVHSLQVIGVELFRIAVPWLLLPQLSGFPAIASAPPLVSIEPGQLAAVSRIVWPTVLLPSGTANLQRTETTDIAVVVRILRIPSTRVLELTKPGLFPQEHQDIAIKPDPSPDPLIAALTGETHSEQSTGKPTKKEPDYLIDLRMTRIE